jgi:hypothetical protein
LSLKDIQIIYNREIKLPEVPKIETEFNNELREFSPVSDKRLKELYKINYIKSH